MLSFMLTGIPNNNFSVSPFLSNCLLCSYYIVLLMSRKYVFKVQYLNSDSKNLSVLQCMYLIGS